MSKIERVLRQKVRSGVFRLAAECLGSHDLILLAAMGIDGREKLAQIFIEEARYLLDENLEDNDEPG